MHLSALNEEKKRTMNNNQLERAKAWINILLSIDESPPGERVHIRACAYEFANSPTNEDSEYQIRCVKAINYIYQKCHNPDIMEVMRILQGDRQEWFGDIPEEVIQQYGKDITK